MPRRKVRRPWLDYLVYIAVRLVVAIAQTLSIEQSYALARLIARLLYHFDRRHRAVGLENLEHAFGNRYSPAERAAIIRRVYLHFAMMLMEILHIPRKLHPETWRQRVRRERQLEAETEAFVDAIVERVLIRLRGEAL